MAKKQVSLVLQQEITTKYRPPDIPMAAIRRFARQIAERFHPDKIVLFGSYAYGKPHQFSDVDLLVIMPAASETNQAIRITLAFERPFPLDLIVRTPHSIRRALADGNWFIREVMEKGKALYEKGNDSLDSKGGRGLPQRQKVWPRIARLLATSCAFTVNNPRKSILKVYSRKPVCRFPASTTLTIC